MKANHKTTVAALACVALGALAMTVASIATALAQETARRAEAPGQTRDDLPCLKTLRRHPSRRYV